MPEPDLKLQKLHIKSSLTLTTGAPQNRVEALGPSNPGLTGMALSADGKLPEDYFGWVVGVGFEFYQNAYAAADLLAMRIVAHRWYWELKVQDELVANGSIGNNPGTDWKLSLGTTTANVPVMGQLEGGMKLWGKAIPCPKGATLKVHVGGPAIATAFDLLTSVAVAAEKPR